MKNGAEVIQLSPLSGHWFHVVTASLIHCRLDQKKPLSPRWEPAGGWQARGGGRHPGRGSGRTGRTCFSTPTNSLLLNLQTKTNKAPDIRILPIFSSLLTCLLSSALIWKLVNVQTTRKALFPFTHRPCRSPEQSTHPVRTSSLPQKTYR